MARSNKRTTRAPQGRMKLYQSYVFKDKDPAIDAIRTVMQDHFGKRNLEHSDYSEVEEQGGPTASCVKQWFEGKTKRPQNATLEAAGRALGYHRVWRRMPRGDTDAKK